MTLPTYTEDQAALQLIGGSSGATHGWNLTAARTLGYSVAGSLSAAERGILEAALKVWSEVSGITFVQTAGAGQISFQNSNANAYCSWTTIGGYATSAMVNISSAWFNTYGGTIGSYSYQTYVHEIGHALGLWHTGNYNGSANFATDALYANDSWQTSVMSYFAQYENPYINASYAYLLTPMAFDIAAMRALYGAPATMHGGDTTYGVGSTAGDALDYLGTANHRAYVAFTLMDTDGTDTLDFSARSEAARVDLTPGAISDLFGQRGNMVIYTNTVIENIRTGAGADRLTGNAAANRISGGDGADTLAGGEGNDTLAGERGNDQLSGNAGADVFIFASGFGTDTVSDFAATIDYVDLSAQSAINSWAALLALMSETASGVLIATAEGSILLSGQSLASLDASHFLLVGGPGVDSGPGVETGRALQGGSGRDTLIGGAGADTIDGSDGHDVLQGGDGNDRVTGGAGNDRITLGAGDDAFLDGADAGSDQVWGGLGNDSLTSLGGADRLFGEEGNDLLVAGGLACTLSGGAGDDTITGGLGGDTVVDSGGNDLVTLGGGNDSYIALGDAATGGDSVEGGEGNDRISAASGNDTILGGAGRDTIQAGEGADRVEGGAEADRIDLGAGDDIFTDASDAGVDTVLGGFGNDTLTSRGGTDSLDGGAGHDSLTASDAGARLQGGLGNDTLWGGAGADQVSDRGGDDLVTLGAGNDSYTASGDTGAMADTISGDAGNDQILAGAGSDAISGGAGNDTLTAGAGTDLLSGGSGADVFVFGGGDEVNRIRDFRVGTDDIDLTGLAGIAVFTDLSGHLTQSGRAVVIHFDGLDITLDNVRLSALTAGDFLL